jgi:hypothetical protein
MANRERVALLVAALRSGKYIQGPGSLERQLPSGEVRNCCLGVACRVAMEHEVPLEVTTGGSFEDGKDFYFEGNAGNLPEQVQEWFGFTEPDPELLLNGPRSFRRSAIECNDGRRMTFAEIADAFERTYVDGK